MNKVIANDVYQAPNAGGTAIDYPVRAPGPVGGPGSRVKKFVDAATAAGVPINCVVRPEGSHTWGLLASAMKESWNTTIGPALG